MTICCRCWRTRAPHLGISLHQLGKREGRCRTHLARLLRIAWLSPRIVEAITGGIQPRKLSRQVLLWANLPID
jgi:hypothetical protein